MRFPDHIIAGFTHGFRHRAALLRLLSHDATGGTLLHLQPEKLRQDGIRVLALDFDGVLAPHGSATPLPEAEQWLRQAAAVFGEEQIFILSNKPTPERSIWFRQHFSRIRFISGVRKKPYPDGLQLIQRTAAVTAGSVLMVDDRLLTGCLAAINAGSSPGYISRPYVSLRQRPFEELFFMTLRSIERIYIRLISLC